MKKQLRLWLLLALGLLVAGTLTISSVQWMKSNVSSARVVHNSRMHPVILVPGSSANQERFNTLVTLLNQQARGHSLLKVTVAENGKLSLSGEVAAGDNEPYIVVAFANNSDGYTNIKRQAKWFKTAFSYLTGRYHFNRFSAIGHSNGGLVLTLFLEKYVDDDTVTMNKLMTLGSPFNLEESSLANPTQMYTDMMKARTKLPKSLDVISVAGIENASGDGIVPLASVEAGRNIFFGAVHSFTQLTVSGTDAQHSALPQNQQIVDMIKQNILSNPGRDRQQ
ncbi:alpha/beta hydrolase [Lacticaseibacillus mingshuiensis]|uniref:Alpha/beta hydrolase n=1 Tax=Lacticaseibacillus mingshuiensis TaxID=2799574 RepID=A0ABW4CK22_9LACO|nr:alpha/beta hydrolase [Lacticaseibacillus mingshuiensis]